MTAITRPRRPTRAGGAARVGVPGARRPARCAAGLVLVAGLAAGLIAAGSGPAAAQQGDPSAPQLDRLVGCLAKDGRVEVAFREERLVTSVDEMLESRGRLVYEPPQRLEKIVEQPREERAVVEGDRMSVFDADGNEKATFDLAERPDLKATFDAVRALLKGDAAALRAGFEVTLSADPDGRGPGAWGMRLSPKDEDAGYNLSRIRVDGQGAPGLTGTDDSGVGDGGVGDGGDGDGGDGGAACRVETIDVRLRDGGRRILHLRPKD